MRTPAGNNCPFFYGNYFRGRKQEECRLIGNQPSPNHWTPDLCKKCPVPAISRANSCPNMILEGEVSVTFLGLRRKVIISAYCTQAQKAVNKPEIGCGLCHQLPEFNVEDNPE